MSLDADIALLGTVRFFQVFDEEHLRLLAFSAETRPLPAGMVLHEAGQALHSAYVITKGFSNMATAQNLISTSK